MTQGFFLVLEGGEGTGKSTVGRWLEQQLKERGYSVFFTREPGGNGSMVAEKIREIILNKNNNVLPLTEAYLFAASRAQHVEEIILPHLSNGDIVICDRFVYSSYAYQGGARQLGDKVKIINSFAIEKVKSNLVLLFDLDPAVGLKRKYEGRQEFDRLDNETLQFHEKVRKTYLTLAAENPDLIKVIDVSKPIEEVEREAWQYLSKNLMG